MIECKNCGHRFEGHYCPECGQHSTVGRFKFKELFVSSIDIELGFFQTILKLTTNPGPSIREFLDGKRLSLFEPGKFLLISGAVATLIVFNLPFFGETDIALPDLFIDREGYHSYSVKYYTLVNVFGTLVYSLLTWLFFDPKKYSFSEVLVLNVYITAYQFILLIIWSPLPILLEQERGWLNEIYFFGIGLYSLWVLIRFYGCGLVEGLLRGFAVIVVSAPAVYYFNWVIYLLIPKSFFQVFEMLLN